MLRVSKLSAYPFFFISNWPFLEFDFFFIYGVIYLGTEEKGDAVIKIGRSNYILRCWDVLNGVYNF